MTRWKTFAQGHTFKLLLLALLVLVLLIPLAMIGGLVNERGRTARDAEAGIMEAWGSELVAVGPMLIVPGIRTEQVSRISQEVLVTETVHVPFNMIVMPQNLDMGADFATEVRHRGIFSVPLFQGGLEFSGTFDLALAAASLTASEELFLDRAELVIALSSQKGIRRIERAAWNGGAGAAELFFHPGNRGLDMASVADFSVNPRWGRGTLRMGGGIVAQVPDLSFAESSFDIAISMQGGRLVRFLPAGRQTRVEVSSDWGAPSFQGAFLPVESDISTEGFRAVWDISYLSRDIPLFWRDDSTRDHSAALFGVDFFRAIDTYSLNTRATRYAALFLVIPFLALFLLEMHTKRNIHPVQYLLSGIANVVFYLLLLSLSEHMHFFAAYTVAALAVTALMTLYSASLLPSRGKCLYVALAMSLSYVLLYAVLNAESHALLIGSLYAFALVAVMMFLTRKMGTANAPQV